MDMSSDLLPSEETGRALGGTAKLVGESTDHGSHNLLMYQTEQ